MKLIAAAALGILAMSFDDAYHVSVFDQSDIVEDDVTLTAGPALLTGSNGMTLYVFEKDGVGTSNCDGDCASNWPPYFAAEDARSPGNGFSIIDRRDGTRQWAKDGAPLYFWSGDKAPGDTNGDEIGGVWHIAG